MKNIQCNNKLYKVLVDSTDEKIEDFLQTDIYFLRKNSEDSISRNQLPLVEFLNGLVKIKFVGELITPNTNFISLPKNFIINEKNFEITLKVLNKYKDLKKDGNTLLSNFSFSYTKDGIESELFFFKKLKDFFLDYITYEFIFPKKRIEIHSPRPIKNSKIDIVKTERDIGRKGPGITYKVKDIKNNNWNLDDIYFTTLVNLLDIYGSDKDREKIINMEKLLKDEGYDIKKVEIDENIVIDQIKKCEVDIKHYPIVNTLIGYYDSKKVSDKYSVRAFYTKNFEYVWEFFSRIVFKYSDEFRKELNIEKLIIRDRDDKITEHDDIRPDIFSDYRGHRFIGDCKYYRNIDGDFYKEMYEYNISLGNKYPMVIFVPSMKTQRYYIRRRASYELFVVKISIEDVINDVMNNTYNVISKVHDMLEVSDRCRN